MTDQQLFHEFFEPFPDDLKYNKPGDKGTFVSWWNYIPRLYEVFPEGWSYSVTPFNSSGGQLLITARITDNVTGSFKEGIGWANDDKESWGGAMAEASSQALRRAAAAWGLGLEMYMKDHEYEYVVGEPPVEVGVVDVTPSDEGVQDQGEIDDELKGAIRIVAKALRRNGMDGVVEEAQKRINANPNYFVAESTLQWMRRQLEAGVNG